MQNSDRGNKVAGRQNGRKVCRMFQRTPAAPDLGIEIRKASRFAMFRQRELAPGSNGHNLCE